MKSSQIATLNLPQISPSAKIPAVRLRQCRLMNTLDVNKELLGDFGILFTFSPCVLIILVAWGARGLDRGVGKLVPLFREPFKHPKFVCSHAVKRSCS